MNSAAIQYMGEAGDTHECRDAIIRLVQYGDTINEAIIITNKQSHGFLLTINNGDIAAIKSGFSSGYGGTGPRGLSYVLQLLHAFGVNLKESVVLSDLLERLDHSALTQKDLDTIKGLHKPVDWAAYILDDDPSVQHNRRLWHHFPLAIPYAIIDYRLNELVIDFWENPDQKLMTAYRRLEDIFRKRCNINEHGVRLFAQAFKQFLTWENVDDSEKTGRANLFTATYMAYRNARAHREPDNDSSELLLELLAVNHLFVLEAQSVVVTNATLQNAIVPE